MEEDQLSERSRLLTIFPEEIWIKILNHCEDDADTLIACSHASVFWRDLLEPRRTIYLFPKVLEILADQNYLTRRDSAGFRCLRLVARNWRLGVNHLLETPPHQKSLQFECYAHNRENDLAYSSYLRLHLSSHGKTWNKLEKEMLPYLDSPVFKDESSPFPSRALEICGLRCRPHTGCINSSREGPNRQNRIGFHPRPQNYLPQSWNDNLSLLMTFLEKAGHHFWSAHISIGDNEQTTISPDQWYRYLSSFVSLMPNLKSLYIQYHDNFQGIVDIQGFPQLRALELLSMDNVCRSAMKSICSLNTHIKVLIVRDLFIVHDPSAFDFGCLHDLSTLSVSIRISEYFQTLPPYWNLKVLRVKLSMYPFLQLNTIFSKLETYKDTLTELQLSLPTYALRPEGDHKFIFWESSKNLLNLPKLKRLEMEVRNICTLDFLLELKSLEYLCFLADHKENVPPLGCSMSQQIDYNRCSDFMKCNIWEKIGSLKKVRIKFNSTSSIQTYNRKDID